MIKRIEATLATQSQSHAEPCDFLDALGKLVRTAYEAKSPSIVSAGYRISGNGLCCFCRFYVRGDSPSKRPRERVRFPFCSPCFHIAYKK